MPRRILIAPDKFKGTLTAAAAAKAIAHGWRKARPDDRFELLPISDGGDGFGAVVGRLVHARTQFVKTADAAGRPCKVAWWWEPKSRTAVIESANVVGLAMLPSKRFHPSALDTFGLGAVVRAASDKGARRCLIGIGGSATNDGGFGLARALGWEFLDRAGQAIEQWTGLTELARLHVPKRRRWFRQLIVAVDVQNPLLGVRGATRVYGPQKGLRRGDLARAERCLRRLAEVVTKQFGNSPDRLKAELHAFPGTGAAGGLGFGLLAFLGARLEAGFERFARLAKLDQRMKRADLVITGEGRLDRSTFMGKGVGQIARRCRRLKIPCLALGGVITDKASTRRAFAKTGALTDLTAPAKAKAQAAYWLERLAEQMAVASSR